MNKWIAALKSSLLLIAIAVMPSLSEGAVDQKAKTFVLCKNQKDIRTIRITSDAKENESCVITYSKAGVDEVVGGSRSLANCKAVLKNIQSNLEASRWACRSVESARITFATEVLEK